MLNRLCASSVFPALCIQNYNELLFESIGGVCVCVWDIVGGWSLDTSDIIPCQSLVVVVEICLKHPALRSYTNIVQTGETLL
jgi:hypothetical protein